MITILKTEEEYSSFITGNTAAVVYFSTESCNVCKTLKPKLIEFLSEKFPRFKFAYSDTEKSPALSAQLGIFTVPTILFLIEGKELLRKSRFINFPDLRNELSRFYEIYFE